LRTPDPAPAIVEASVLRHGRSASQIRTRLSQSGKVCAEALVTLGELGAQTSVYWDVGVPSTSSVGYDECVRLPSRAPNGMSVNMLEQVDLRLEPASLGFAFGRPSGRGELRGWLSLLDDGPF
jgi:hypothetical protein